jgi:hypothetical protein
MQQNIHAINSFYKIHLDYKNTDKSNIYLKFP